MFLFHPRIQISRRHLYMLYSCYQAVVCTRRCSGIVSVEVIHFLECIGYGLSIDKPKFTKLAAELVPPL